MPFSVKKITAKDRILICNLKQENKGIELQAV